MQSIQKAIEKETLRRTIQNETNVNNRNKQLGNNRVGVSPNMAKKSSTKKIIDAAKRTAELTKKVAQISRKINTLPIIDKTPFGRHPFETTGGLLGPAGRKVGKFLGTITGSGDYAVSANSIMTESTHTLTPSVPQFRRNLDGSTTISHREFVGDIYSGSLANTFNIQTFSLNPGMANVFPWLSVIAMQYDQWRPDGIVMTFKSTSSSYSGGASQALGTVIMASDYDLTDPSYSGKVEMNNSQFAISCKSDHTMMHPIECAPNQRPIRLLKTRDGPTSDNLQWYDLANFQIATDGLPVANVNVGELWVTYEITFYKEQLYGGIYGGSVLENVYMFPTAAVNAPFGGSPQSVGAGNKLFNITFPTSALITMTGVTPGMEFSVEMYISGAAAATAAHTPALTGATFVTPIISIFPSNNFIGIGAGTSIICSKHNLRVASGQTAWALGFSGGTYPTGGSCFLRITLLNRANY